MDTWQVVETARGLRLSTPIPHRALGSPTFTWTDLLRRQLQPVQVYVLYFPSRFDLPVDMVVKAALEVFGRQTGPETSINVWDPTDQQFSKALAFFGIATPPALLLMRGWSNYGDGRLGIDDEDLYTLILTDLAILGDRVRLASAVNIAHEVLIRADPKEIAGYLRDRAIHQLLSALERIGSGVRDTLLSLKPKLQLPGGVALALG